MTLLLSAVKQLEAVVSGCGCDDAGVTIRRNPDAPRCQFERGVTLEAALGGRTAHVVTSSPVQTDTRLSSLFGQDLPTPEHRTAALAMVNGAAGFLCLARKIHACDPGCYAACFAELQAEIRGRRIHMPVKIPVLSESLASLVTGDAGEAGIMILTGETLIREEDPGWAEPGAGGRILLLGPSTAGVASLLSLPHWCPYGR